MSNPYFQFKQFTIWHDKCAMKVGTDGVLLGAWAQVEQARRILDVGSGTGLVALMLAQRSAAEIVALEIDESAVVQAKENVDRSPWAGRIQVLQADFNVYDSATKFDVIVSNPPYFADSLRSPDARRTFARHAASLTYEGLLSGVSKFLSEDGTFTLVIPAEMSDKVKCAARLFQLFPVRQLNVRTKPEGEIKRVLLSFSWSEQSCEAEELLTEMERHRYSDAYIALTKAYYLNM